MMFQVGDVPIDVPIDNSGEKQDCVAVMAGQVIMICVLWYTSCYAIPGWRCLDRGT